MTILLRMNVMIFVRSHQRGRGAVHSGSHIMIRRLQAATLLTFAMFAGLLWAELPVLSERVTVEVLPQ